MLRCSRCTPAGNKFLLVSVCVVSKGIDVELAPEMHGGGNADHVQVNVLRRFWIEQRVLALGFRAEVIRVELWVRLVDRTRQRRGGDISSRLHSRRKHHTHGIEVLVDEPGVVCCAMSDVQRVLAQGSRRCRHLR